MPKSAVYAAPLLLAVTVGLAAAHTAKITVRDVWSRATPPGTAVGVAYLVIDNHGASDRLLGASSPIAKRTQLHVTTIEHGIVNMTRLNAVEIKSGTTVAFAPGGRHIMLMGLKRPLKKGDTFPLTLRFRGAGAVHVTAHVLGIGDTPARAH